MYYEITSDLFFLAINSDTEETLIEETELAIKQHYYVLGCKFLRIYNYVSAVEQYYIEDINA